eukprot:6044200-Amphidinium_carterae.2
MEVTTELRLPSCHPHLEDQSMVFAQQGVRVELTRKRFFRKSIRTQHQRRKRGGSYQWHADSGNFGHPLSVLHALLAMKN